MTISLQYFLKDEMSKIIRFAGILILTSIYCYAVSVATHSIVNFNIIQHSDAEVEAYFETVSSTFFFHTNQTESQVNTCSNVLAQSFKYLFPFINATLKTIEHYFETKFSSYNSTSESFPVHSRKSDLIFPFQYFW